MNIKYTEDKFERMVRLLQEAERSADINPTRVYVGTEDEDDDKDKQANVRYLEWVFPHGRFGYFVGENPEDSSWFLIWTDKKPQSGSDIDAVPLDDVMQLIKNQK